MEERRTEWAERFFERFAGIPLTAECVYYSPQFIDGGIQKEVCDFLLVLKGEAILVSMKSQEDPTKKIGEKLARWVEKNARGAVSQARGALRTLDHHPFWCRHRRRGRVDFAPGAVNVIHVVVIPELFWETVELPAELPLEVGGVQVTYLSVNDFLNLVYELRAFADISSYLRERRTLPAKALRTVGDEKPLYSYYILNGDSFDGCRGYEDARITAAAKGAELERHASLKSERDRMAGAIECVSDRVAMRLEGHLDGVHPALAAGYDDTAARKNYLLLQEELCDLGLGDRRAIGMQLNAVTEAVERSGEPECMHYGVGYVDAKPDFLYLLIAAKGIERPPLLARENLLLRAALAYFGKPRGMAIADRDGKNFEVQMIAGFRPAREDVEAGVKLFAHLKMSGIQTGVRRNEKPAAAEGILWVPPSARSQ